jgi:hypothetical protein
MIRDGSRVVKPGSAALEQHESERPIEVVRRHRHPMPAQMFEMNRRGG